MIYGPKNPESGICCMLQQKVKHLLYATATRVVARYVCCAAGVAIGSLLMFMATFDFIGLVIENAYSASANETGDTVVAMPWLHLVADVIVMIYKAVHLSEDIEKARHAQKRLNKLRRVIRRSVTRRVRIIGKKAKSVLVSAVRR